MLKSLHFQSSRNGQPPYGWLTCPIGLIDLPNEQRQEPLLLDMSHNGGHVLIAGASGTGKSVFLRTLITSLIHTHSPAQLHLYLIDFGGQALRVFEKLPHIGGVFGEIDEEYIRRLLRKLQGIIDERKQYCTTHQIDDFLAYQRRRLDHPHLPELPAVVLVIDKFTEFKQVHERDMELLLSIARYGRTYGVYIVLTVDRPVAMPMQLMSLIELRIGLRLVELTDSLVFIGKHDATYIDPTIPGRGYKRSKLLEEVQIALPVAGEDDDEQTRQLDGMVAAIERASKGPHIPHAPTIRLLPEYVRADYFLMDAISSVPDGIAAPDRKTLPNGKSPHGTPASTSSLRIRLGIEDFSLQPIALELNADTPHVLVAGGPGSGRTGVLHTCLMMLASTPTNKYARIILVDFRCSSRLMRRLPNMWLYADNEEKLTSAIGELKQELEAREARLHEQLEQQQEDSDELFESKEDPIVLIIDDYEQFSMMMKNPFHDIKEFLLQARDLRLHIIVAGAPNDLSKGEPLLQQVRACRMGVILGADPQDQQLLGVRMSDLPVGRGYVVRRNKRYLAQMAHLAPDGLSQWLMRLKTSGRTPQAPQAPQRQTTIVREVSEDQQLLEEARRLSDAVMGDAV